VASAGEYSGYPNLDKATRLQRDVDAAHGVVQLDLQQQMQKDDLTYTNLRGVTAANQMAAAQREEQLFGPTGLLSMGLGLLGVGGLGGMIGLMRKRPGDVTSAELQQAVADATGKASVELSAKQRQFMQLVQGIGSILVGMQANPSMLSSAKTMLDQTQDTDTQVAVSAVRKELNL
jgi:hypothetical protein